MEACIAAESPATKARPLEQSSAPAPKRQRLESDSGPCDVDAMDLSAECVDALPLPPRRSRRLSSANKQPCTRPVQPPASRRQPVEVPSVPKSARQKGQNDGASHKSAACSRNGKRVQPADGAPAANGAPAAGNRADKSKTQKGKPEPSSRPPQGKARPQQKAKAEAEAPQTEWQVMFAEDDPEEVRARSEVKRILERFVVAREEAMKREVKRVEKEGGVMRPDLVGMRMCIDKGDCMYRTKRAGTLPGLPVGTTMLARAELSVLGLHHHWLAGIDAIDISKTPSRAAPRAPAGAPAFPQLSATDDDAADAGGRQLVTEEYYGGFVSSVMVSGMYEDDHDADGGERFIYTGEGGNDMLGNKKQVANQKLTKGNLKLIGNICLKVPVRVVRKNPDSKSYTKHVYIYDGLYWVTRCWLHKGVSGFSVYQYEFRRLPGQPKAKHRPGFLVTDLSRGLHKFPNGKPNPIAVVNTVDKTPAPQALLPGEEAEPAGRALMEDEDTECFVYITANRRDVAVPEPPPARPEDSTPAAIKKLNLGTMPYVGSNRLCTPYDVVYEVPPHVLSDAEVGPMWTPQWLSTANATQLGCSYRLEVFRTESKGWGVRSWDHIPSGGFVAEFTGTIHTLEAFRRIEEVHKGKRGCKAKRADYAFDLQVTSISDRQSDDGEEEGAKVESGDARMADANPSPAADATPVPEASEDEDSVGHVGPEAEPSFTLDGYEYGSVARLINHSREQPNLFIQCILSDHHDREQPRLCLFAMENIPALTELCYDYGQGYEQFKLGESLRDRRSHELRKQALAHHPGQHLKQVQRPDSAKAAAGISSRAGGSGRGKTRRPREA